MGNLTNWLHERNEENILNKTIAHVQKTLECVVEFERGFGFLVKEGNPKLAREVFLRVNKIEHDADILRRDILHNITSMDMPAEIHEDLIHLVNHIDHIANATNGAARRIVPIKDADIKALGQDNLQKMLDMLHFSVEAGKVLFNLIKKLPTLEANEIFSYTEQIQALEHKCDVLHSEIYASLNNLTVPHFNPFIAIQLLSFIDLIEDISDKVEDVADYIDLLRISKKS